MTTYDRETATGRTMADSVDETHELISARKVDGTSVYNANGDSLGSIHDIMINKRTGQVAYAVMSFGGFLGIGEKYHPLPWNMLKYDENQGGYRVNLSDDKLRNGPAYSQTELDDDFVVGGYGRRVQDYYGTGL
jgi:sporulation protein YlmC with PRC-barrel domain